MHVFISYSRQDKDEARKIASGLKKAGIQFFLDEQSIAGGEEFQQRIKQEIFHASDMFLLVTPNSIASDWVKHEWSIALAFDKHITPILLSCSPENLPVQLAGRQTRGFHELDTIISEYKHRQANSPHNGQHRNIGYIPSNVGFTPGSETVVNIDICNSGLLKELMNAEISYQTVIKDFHEIAQQVFCNDFHGNTWLQMGDCRVFLFDHPQKAGMASLTFLENLKHLNTKNEVLRDTPLFVRIGIEVSDRRSLWNTPESQRSTTGTPALDRATELQQECPTGRIAVSGKVYEQLGVIDKLFRPTVGDSSRFILEHRSLNPQEEKLAGNFSPKQKDALPALCFLNWKYLRPQIALKDLKTRITADKWTVVMGETNRTGGSPFTSAATHW